MGSSKNNNLERAVAFVIDSFFVVLLSNFVLNVFYYPDPAEFGNHFQLFTFLAYFLFFDYVNNGQTMGKIFLNIEGNKQWDFKKRMTRSFLKLVSIFLMPVTIIYYLVKKKILHDILFNSNEVVHN